MSCFKKKTSEDVENEKISKNIEAQIKEDRKKEANQIKLLLLGELFLASRPGSKDSPETC